MISLYKSDHFFTTLPCGVGCCLEVGISDADGFEVPLFSTFSNQPDKVLPFFDR
jgi:hypothetical protein